MEEKGIGKRGRDIEVGRGGGGGTYDGEQSRCVERGRSMARKVWEREILIMG